MADNEIFVRAKPKTVRLTETYHYHQEIAVNPVKRQSGPGPEGRLEIEVPYDGRSYFTRQAWRDAEYQLKQQQPGQMIDALIGHLAVTDYELTDLNEMLDLNYGYGTLPLRIPLANETIKNLDQLISDEHSAIISIHYSPAPPSVFPIDVEMAFFDEDIPLGTSSEADVQGLNEVASLIARDLSFRRNLILRIRVRLHLPEKLAEKDLRPMVKKLSIDWPTITSRYSQRLFVGEDSAAVNYNPAAKRMEWSDIPLAPQRGAGSNNLLSYLSEPMRLMIDHPGEIYQQGRLQGRVEVEIPGCLLSGLNMRVYDAIGKLYSERELKPETATHLNASVELYSEDIFSKRRLSPYQLMYFDDLIPDEMRVADIKAALVDRGFQVDSNRSRTLSNDGGVREVIFAHRNDGPNLMELLLYVDGTRQEATRKTQRADGQETTYKTEVGELKVHIRGSLEGGSHRLVQEMASFQEVLRDRFEPLRTRK